MLRGPLTHPDMLRALGTAGHGSTVLISDGNFPHASASPRAKRVYLNVAPDLVRVTDILPVVLQAVAVESVSVMIPDDPKEARPSAHGAFAEQLPANVPMKSLDRWAFYDACRDDSLVLVIATGDLRPYANILLSLGVVQ